VLSGNSLAESSSDSMNSHIPPAVANAQTLKTQSA
jgi:hypothetical protein